MISIKHWYSIVNVVW